MAYLREENRILKAKLWGRRIHLTDTERRCLAVLAHPVDRKHLRNIAPIATTDILQRWRRRLVDQDVHHMEEGKKPGRSRVAIEYEVRISVRTHSPTLRRQLPESAQSVNHTR